MKPFWDQLGAVSLMLLLTIAAAFGLGFVFIGGGEWILTAWQARTEGSQPTFYEYLQVTSDGEAFIQHGQWTPVSELTYYDLDRNEIPEPQGSWSGSLGHLRYRPDPPPSLAFRPQVADRVVSVAERVRGMEEWFLVADSAAGTTAYFEGFDVLTRRRVGFIGTNGFTHAKLPDDERFPLNHYTISRYYGTLPTGRDRIYLLHDQTVRMIDFAVRDVQVLVEGGLSIANVNHFGPRGSIVSTDRLAVRLADAVRVYDELGELTATLPVPASIRERDIHLFELGDEALLIGSEPDADFIVNSQQRRVDERPSTVVRVADARVISEKNITLRRNQRIGNTTHNVLVAGIPALAWGLGVAIPSSATQSQMRGQAESFSAAYLRALGEHWLPLAIILLVTGVCVWLVYRHSSRRAGGEFWIAVAVVVVLGLPGYIGYRLHRSWPRRGEAPEIARTGSEIFA